MPDCPVRCHGLGVTRQGARPLVRERGVASTTPRLVSMRIVCRGEPCAVAMSSERRKRQSRPAPSGPLRAAEYVRMSTEHQQYSTENQHAAIQRYADEPGLLIVRTFTDAGKSGLGIQ